MSLVAFDIAKRQADMDNHFPLVPCEFCGKMTRQTPPHQRVHVEWSWFGIGKHLWLSNLRSTLGGKPCRLCDRCYGNAIQAFGPENLLDAAI